MFAGMRGRVRVCVHIVLPLSTAVWPWRDGAGLAGSNLASLTLMENPTDDIFSPFLLPLFFSLLSHTHTHTKRTANMRAHNSSACF